MDTAIIIVGGLRELLVIALQRGRDMRELRSSAAETVKAILSGSPHDVRVSQRRVG